MSGIQNFLTIVYNNWTTILVCIGLVIGIVKKTIDFFSKSNKEKVAIAKSQIQVTVLKMISDAEIEWEDWSKAGSIKRAQVIKQIYDEYPILSTVATQEEVIAFIDHEIDNSLKTLRAIVAENK